MEIQLDIEVKIHTLTRQIIESVAVLEQQMSAYKVSGVATVKELDATMARARTAIAAGLVGLLIGVAVALIRDRSWRTASE